MKLNLDLHPEPIERPKILDSYRENMITYLETIHPETPKETIRKFVEDSVKQRAQKLWDNLLAAHKNIDKYRELVRTQVIPKMAELKTFKSAVAKEEFIENAESEITKFPVAELLKMLQEYGVDAPSPRSVWPTIKAVKAVDPDHPKSKKLSYGNLVEFPELDMLGFSNDYRTKIISPAGSIYETSNNDVAFLTNKIINDKARRSERKKLMLKYRKLGDMAKAKIYNNQQATIKINMNSTSGSMGCNGNFLSSPANYNSITSISRFFIMNAYANSERFLESNFYFRTVEQVLNFLVTCVRLGPDDDTVLKACESVSLHLPSSDEVEKFLMSNAKQYCFESDFSAIHKFLIHCTPARLAFIFYMSNFKNVVMTNDAFWRPWMEDILSDVNVDYTKQRNPKDIKNVDGDLISVISTAYNDWLPKNKKGNNISIYDCLDPQPEQGVPEAHPDIVCKFLAIAEHMESKLKQIEFAFDVFMNHKVSIGYVDEHKFMFRKAIGLSDTDSIIFTTKSWVKWFNGDLKFTKRAYSMNALMVYFLTKATIYLQYRVSETFNAVGKDLLTMSMKNEFMMPVVITTSAKKHYCSLLKIQEGVVYAKPRLDIKGVGLRGSNFSTATTNYVTWFIESTLYDVTRNGVIDPVEKILAVLRYERMVYDSLTSGNTEFLEVESIRTAEEYADPDRSIYFGYKFWEQVYSATYGSILIPTKAYVVDVDYKRMISKAYHDKLVKTSEQIANQLELFVSSISAKKSVNLVPINSTLEKVPVELRAAMRIRDMVYKRTRPLYMILRSLNIVTGGNPDKDITLLSDIYGWVSSEEGAKAREHT
jgi:hypothetical protein